jgi:membrane fusion protein, copper/silver efflux system
MRTVILVAFAAALSSAAAFADELTPAIVDPAVAIQTSLAKDSLTGVAANAGTIEEQAGKLGAPAAKIAEAARELKATTKIADARTAFGKLSEALVQYMDAQKLTLDPRIRVAMCPMVNKPWLQRDGPIQNPYYGTQMPTCGSFKK